MPTITEADNYFSERLWTDEWDSADDLKKNTALKHAKKEIDALNFSTKLSTEDYKKAIFEQTIFLLNLGPEDLKRLNLQAQGVTDVNVSKAVSESYQLNGTAYSPVVRQLKEKYEYQVGDLI